MAATIETTLSSAKAYDEISQSGMLIQGWSDQTKGSLRRTALRFLADVSALGDKAKATDRDKNLTPGGKFNETRKSVQQVYENQTWLRLEKSAIETSLGSAFGELFLLPSSTRPDQGLRDQWLWSDVEKRSMPERIAMYLHAAEVDNVELLRAIKDAPRPLIDDEEVMLRADSQRAARLQPELYRRFAENSELLDALSGMLNGANDLAREYGVEVKDTFGELGPKVRAYANYATGHPITESNVGSLAPRPKDEA